MGAPVTAILTIGDIHLNYGNRPVLNGISFAVQKGEHLAIVGANGSGKSTLIRAVARLVNVSSGAISVMERPLSRIDRRTLARFIAYVPQAHFERIPFTVREYLRLARYPYTDGWTGLQPSDDAAVENALNDTGLTSLAERQTNQLSGGEAQKVLIAAALAQDTPILLLDEATAFLDVKHKSDIHCLLDTLNQQHQKTILQVTHDLNHAALSCQRIIALKAGRIIFDGIPKRFMTSDVLASVYAAPFDFATHPVTGEKVVVPKVAP